MIERTVRVGAFAFLLRSPLGLAMRTIDRLYADYPSAAADGLPDYIVAVEPTSALRRWVRPKVRLACDIEIPLMEPMPAAHAALALEMGMNLQLAAGMYRYLLLHAGSVERDGRGLLLIGDSGSGKSTLSAALGYSGWRFMGDEFALLDPATGALRAHPRPISLKNAAIAHAQAFAPADRFGPVLDNTVKGRIRHLRPPVDAIARMDDTAAPALILAPRFTPDAVPEARRMGAAETFVRLTQSSTNYGALGEAGFEALWLLVDACPAYEVAYGSTADARALVDRLWADA